MRILFGVQGTGNGHISRSRTLARALKARGIEVDYLFSGRAADGSFEMGEFGGYRTFPGITFASHQGRISGWRTLKGLSPLRFWQDLRALDCRDYANAGLKIINPDMDAIERRLQGLEEKPKAPQQRRQRQRHNRADAFDDW